MYCGNCGFNVPDNLTVCPKCKATVRASAPAPVQAPPPVNHTPPKKKKSKTTAVIIILSFIFAIVIAVFAFFFAKYLSETKKAESAPADSGLVDVTNEGGITDIREADISSENLEDMAFIINGIEYRFPLKLDDFTVNGWSLSVDGGENDSIPAGGTLSRTFVCGNDSFNVVFFNPTGASLAVKDCYIGEISSTWVDITLAKNITTHASTRADIVNAYGQPVDGSSAPYYYYGSYSAQQMSNNYPVMNTLPFYTLKFDENTASTGASDSDKLLYVNIQWYDPDAVNRYNERSGN